MIRIIKNKRGTFVGDFFMLILGGLFLVFIISTVLLALVDDLNKQSSSKISQLKRYDSAIDNIRVLVNTKNEIAVEDIDSLIASSKTLGGRTITTCADYITEADCDQDVVNIIPATSNALCAWETYEEQEEFTGLVSSKSVCRKKSFATQR